ncbi:hypothetical protein BC567DRAFT_237213 [Phyllosticta citribraziliensis]
MPHSLQHVHRQPPPPIDSPWPSHPDPVLYCSSSHFQPLPRPTLRYAPPLHPPLCSGSPDHPVLFPVPMPMRMSHYYYNEADLAMMDIFPASASASSSSSAPSSTIYAPPCHMPPHQRSGYDPRTTSVSMTGYLPQPSAMPHQSYSHQNYWTGHHQHSVPHQHPLPQATMGLPSMAPYPSSTIAYAHSQPFAPETTLPSSYSLHHRSERSPSTVSTGAFSPQPSVDGSIAGAEYSRSISPSSNSPDLRAYGYLNKNGTWTCAYPGCTSKAVFTRGCDLRKHHKRHTKSFFCRQEGCPQATGGGFSSKKDLARHEAKHNPGVICEWEGCERIFSRVDNMRDHVKRIHLKGARPQPAKRGSTS